MAEKTLKERSLLSDQFKWKLEDIFPDNASWENEFLKTKKDLEGAAKLKGTLGESGEALFDALERIFDVELNVERLFVYARMRLDEDNANSNYQGLADRGTSLTVETQSALSFVHPEIIKISDDKMASFFKECGKLSKYRHMIDVIAHEKEHILPDEQEKLLAMSARWPPRRRTYSRCSTMPT